MIVIVAFAAGFASGGIVATILTVRRVNKLLAHKRGAAHWLRMLIGR